MSQVTSVTASAAGPTTPIAITGQSYGGVQSGSFVVDRYQMQPAVLASAAGTLNFILEVTCDQPNPDGTFKAPGNWAQLPDDAAQFPFPGSSPTRTYALRALYTGIRANIVGYTSGSLNLTVSQ